MSEVQQVRKVPVQPLSAVLLWQTLNALVYQRYTAVERIEHRDVQVQGRNRYGKCKLEAQPQHFDTT